MINLDQNIDTLKGLRVTALSALVKAVFNARDEDDGMPFLCDDEFVALHNVMELASNGYNSEELIKSVDNDLDAETFNYHGRELLEMAGGVNRYGQALLDCTWYSINPSTGTFEWSDDPFALQVAHPNRFNDAVIDVLYDDVGRHEFWYMLINECADAVEPLVRYLELHPELENL